jgi:hypothetical protein
VPNVVVVPALFLKRMPNVVVVPALFLKRMPNVVVVPALFLKRMPNVVVVPALFIENQRGAHHLPRGRLEGHPLTAGATCRGWANSALRYFIDAPASSIRRLH